MSDILSYQERNYSTRVQERDDALNEVKALKAELEKAQRERDELQFYLQHKDELDFVGDKAKQRIADLEKRLTQAQQELAEERRLLDGLLNLTDNEGKHGWRVTLDYNNYQDGARIIDADDNVVADCYDLEVEPNEQFKRAIDKALANATKEEEN